MTFSDGQSQSWMKPKGWKKVMNGDVEEFVELQKLIDAVPKSQPLVMPKPLAKKLAMLSNLKKQSEEAELQKAKENQEIDFLPLSTAMQEKLQKLQAIEADMLKKATDEAKPPIKFSINFNGIDTMFKCMQWRAAVNWPTVNSSNCCALCHTEGHNADNLRLVSGATYKVCCGTKKLCLKDLKTKWWCGNCKKEDVTPVNYEDGVVCFTCSEPITSYNILDINPLTKWCPSCNMKQTVVVETDKPGYKKVFYCSQCKWPVMIEKQPFGATSGYSTMTGAYKKYLAEHMNNLVPVPEKTEQEGAKIYKEALKKMKLKELYGF